MVSLLTYLDLLADHLAAALLQANNVFLEETLRLPERFHSQILNTTCKRCVAHRQLEILLTVYQADLNH